MKHYSDKDYKDYIEMHLQIMRRRSKVCEEVMKQVENYEYWTYNYAYYLCSLNVEQLNFLRYVFGMSVHSFFEAKVLQEQKYYRKCIEHYGYPKNLDWKDRLFCIYINRPSVLVTQRLQMPPCFGEVEEELEELNDTLLGLISEYEELGC